MHFSASKLWFEWDISKAEKPSICSLRGEIVLCQLTSARLRLNDYKKKLLALWRN